MKTTVARNVDQISHWYWTNANTTYYWDVEKWKQMITPAHNAGHHSQLRTLTVRLAAANPWTIMVALLANVDTTWPKRGSA